MASGSSSNSNSNNLAVDSVDNPVDNPVRPPTPRLRPVTNLPRFPACAEECLYLGLSLRTYLAAKQLSKGTTETTQPPPTKEIAQPIHHHVVQFH
jgi:hypothetical protein